MWVPLQCGHLSVRACLQNLQNTLSPFLALYICLIFPPNKQHAFLTRTLAAATPSNASLTSTPLLTCVLCQPLTPSCERPVCQPPWIIHLICPFDKASHFAAPPTLKAGEKCVYPSLCVSLFHFLLLSSPLPQLAPLFLRLILSRKTPRSRPLYWHALSQWFAKVDVTGSEPCSCLLESHTFASIEFFRLVSSASFDTLCLTTGECFFFPCYNLFFFSLVLSLIIYANCSPGST